jgi:hypothetical protein
VKTLGVFTAPNLPHQGPFREHLWQVHLYGHLARTYGAPGHRVLGRLGPLPVDLVRLRYIRRGVPTPTRSRRRATTRDPRPRLCAGGVRSFRAATRPARTAGRPRRARSTRTRRLSGSSPATTGLAGSRRHGCRAGRARPRTAPDSYSQPAGSGRPSHRACAHSVWARRREHPVP